MRQQELRTSEAFEIVEAPSIEQQVERTPAQPAPAAPDLPKAVGVMMIAAYAALIGALRKAGFAAVVSGAGPTVLVLANGAAQAGDAVAFIESFTANNTPDIGWRVLKLAVDVEGAKVDLHRR